jgi:type IV fimbrial biogenesis protein FimT
MVAKHEYIFCIRFAGGLIMKTTRSERGASLLEMLAALGVSAALVGVAVPWITGLAADMGRSSETNGFLADLAMARVEAIRRGARVVLCVSGDQSTCATSGYWSQGRIMFVDSNNNARRDDGESVLQVREATESTWRIKGNATVASYISYHPIGRSRLTNGGFQAGTLTICPMSASSTKASQIVISAAGRPRSQRVEIEECL